MSKLTYTVKRGKNSGVTLTPHWFTEEGGYFRAHKKTHAPTLRAGGPRQGVISSSWFAWAITCA